MIVLVKFGNVVVIDRDCVDNLLLKEILFNRGYRLKEVKVLVEANTSTTKGARMNKVELVTGEGVSGALKIRVC